jgi:hypothetical protein
MTIKLLKVEEKMRGVGFEPTHPKILEPESSALDLSANLPIVVFRSDHNK